MHRTIIILFLALLPGCTAKLNFIDRSDGEIYIGTTGGTSGGSGEATATINGVNFKGPWIYSSSGGSYSLSNFNATSSATGTSVSGGSTTTIQAIGSGTGSMSTFAMSAHGNGLINLRGENGMFMRCVFMFNTLSNTGLGQCLRNDGREYDLTIKR